MGNPSRKQLIPAHFVLATAFFTASLLVSEYGAIGTLLWALLLFMAIVTALHGHWQTILGVLWKLPSHLARHQKRVNEQSRCKICMGPTRVLAIEFRELEVAGILDPKECFSCGICGKIALFHIDIGPPVTSKENKEEKVDPEMSKVCLDHHPNPVIGKHADETLRQLRGLQKLPLWVQPILYPTHVKPTYDEARHHHLCGNHYPVKEVGAKYEETTEYFLKHRTTWGALIPVYEPTALISSKDPVKK